MATTCSHQDQSRKSVSATALLIAYARSIESSKPEGERLFYDPYALELSGELGKSSISLSGEAEEDWHSEKKRAFLRAITARTKIIDDYIEESICLHNIEQVVVFGAGLDTRPWRLHPFRSLGSPSQDDSQLRTIQYFEVDFPEVFDYKLDTLNRLGACTDSCLRYHNVVADLSLPEIWPLQLESAGFIASRQTLWVMEGFCNYLTEEELVKLMKKVYDLTSTGSRLISTFLTPSSTHVSLKLHRFFPLNPLQFMSQFGWTGFQEDIDDIASQFGIIGANSVEELENKGYFIVKLCKQSE